MRCPTAKTVQCRVEEEIFSSSIFETLRAQFENELEFRRLVMSKIVPVHGDLVLEQLGLSESDLRMVQSDTNVIFNCAADTSWDRGLKEAVNVSIRNGKQYFFLSTANMRKAVRVLATKEQ